MTPKEAGLLLLCSHLGNPQRRPLTPRQYAKLQSLIPENCTMPPAAECGDFFRCLGLSAERATEIQGLLSEKYALDYYRTKAQVLDYTCITLLDPRYPQALRKLGPNAPTVLWAKGDLEILNRPGVALVGSRNLLAKNAEFAQAVGRMASKQQLVLISGGARGADSAAQNGCHYTGGQVLSVLPAPLDRQPWENTLYLWEDGFDLEFSAQRALSRNRIIHSLGQKTFVAQVTKGHGGTWAGTTENLRHGLSPVFLFDDGSEGVRLLSRQGAIPIPLSRLSDLSALQDPQISLF